MQYIQIVFKRWLAGIALLSSTTACSLASDDYLHPFAIRNNNPFFGIYGIPSMQAPAVVAPGGYSTQLQLDVVSHFTDAGNDREFIAIDGETHRLALRFALGLANQWEVGAEVPLVSHSGGFLDSVINEWHAFFGLPTLGRDQVEDDQLRYQYFSGGEPVVDERSSGTGIGDISLFGGKTLNTGGDYLVTLRGQLKLPTGDPNRLRGSGGTDAALSATVSRAFRGNWSISARIGAAYLGTGDVLPALQRRWSGFGGVFAGWQAFKSISLKAQLDIQSPIYHNSDLDQLTDTALQVTLGASARVGTATVVDVSFTEDELNPDVSSDFAFQVRLRVLR